MKSTYHTHYPEVGLALRRAWRRGLKWLLAGAIAVAVPCFSAGSATADGSYPGETLSLSLAGPSVAGQLTRIVASGQQTDVNSYAGGFLLDVFAKDPTVDPTCAPDYMSESNNAMNDPGESRAVVGDWQGMGTSFSVPFSIVFPNSGSVLLCGYSIWITDTAASGQLTFQVAGSSASQGQGAGNGSSGNQGQAVAKPVNERRPRVTRSGRQLLCSTGTWSGAPVAFSFRWSTGRHAIAHARGSRLRISRALRGHRVRCSVTAANAGGTATAASPAIEVR